MDAWEAYAVDAAEEDVEALVEEVEALVVDKEDKDGEEAPVSYTHLTLPTILLV